jgi:hypothetical protein
MVQIVCSSCGHVFSVPEEARGKKALCPGCAEETPVPEAVSEKDTAHGDTAHAPPQFASHRWWRILRKAGLAALSIIVIIIIFIVIRAVSTSFTAHAPLLRESTPAYQAKEESTPPGDERSPDEQDRAGQRDGRGAAGRAEEKSQADPMDAAALRNGSAYRLLDECRALEAAGQWDEAAEKFGELAADFSDTPAGAETSVFLAEKLRTLLFKKALSEARTAYEQGRRSRAAGLYKAMRAEYPESADALEAEDAYRRLVGRAEELAAAGAYREALKALDIIGSNGDVFWRRIAYARRSGIQRLLDGARDTMTLAVGAEKRGDFSTAYRLYDRVVRTAPRTQWAADAKRAQGLVELKMPYGRRFQEKNRFLLPEVRNAVSFALDFLARHQDDSGRWAAAGFAAHCEAGKCTGAGLEGFDAGVTALALLAFLGEGSTHFTGERSGTVKKALRYLLSEQDKDGLIGKTAPARWLYNHALATAALAEAYGMTADVVLRKKSQAAVDALVRKQAPGGSWRYCPESPGDASLTCTAAWALLSAKKAGLDVPANALAGVRRWINGATAAKSGFVSYTVSDAHSASHPLAGNVKAAALPAVTAQAAGVRMLMGEDASSAPVSAAVRLVRKNLPIWDRASPTRTNFYYWYFGTLLLASASEEAYAEWIASLRSILLKKQEKAGDAAGSWPPEGRWGHVGGRLYSTALGVLILQAPYNRPADFFSKKEEKK